MSIIAFNIDNIVTNIHSKNQFKLLNIMKKFILSGGIPQTAILLFISAFAFGQSVLIQPNKQTNTSSSGDNIAIESSSAFIGVQAVRFNGTISAKTSVLNTNLLGSVGGGGYYSSSNFYYDKANISFKATENWTNSATGTKITFSTNPNGSVGFSERLVINHDGKIGIGVSDPQSNLHINDPNGGTNANTLKITHTGSGSTASDGLDISLFSVSDIFSLGASIMNKENGSLYLGTNSSIMMNLSPAGNFGINNIFASPSTGRFQVTHNTANSPSYPHINLKTSVNASNGMIRMENLDGSKFFGQYFNLNSATPANNFVSFDYNGTTSILDMQGNGNVKVSGFTTLGNDVAAPKIKMKKLSGAFSPNANSSGTPTFIPHGVADPSKIITINVLGQYAGSGGYVSNSFLTSNGYQFDYQIDGVNIIITPKQGNSASLVSQNIKIVVTYEE